ncbi:MAG: type VI secretion system contractile sheath protein TssC [Lentimicrobium sp.]
MAKSENEQIQSDQLQSLQSDSILKDVEKIVEPVKVLEQAISKLEKFGGFDLLEGAVDGLENMNPSNRASKSIFLSESEFHDNRENLKSSLAMWIALLANNEKVTDMVETSRNDADKVDKTLKSNLKNALKRTEKLERSYRAVSFFFKNSEAAEVEYLSVINADKNQLQDSESRFFKTVSDELNRFYDRLNLKNNYSLLVIPGYLGSKQAVNIWGKIAYKNKVLLITDFKDRPDFKMLKESLEKESLSGGDIHLSSVLLTCNWLVGRKNYKEVDEEEPLYVPAAGALAGKLYNTEGIVISQGAAGKKHGTLNEVQGTRLDLLKSEIASLIDLSVVPIVYEDNRVMAFSNKSLFNGNPIGLREYSIVRVFDWIGKVFMNFFNDVAFQNWNTKLKNDLKEEITKFLDDYRGPGKLIEDYRYQDIKQDPITKDITIEIDIKPFFAAKNFHIKLTGHEGTAGKEWDQKVD